MKNKPMRILSWTVTGLVTLIFLASATFKLMGGDEAMRNGLGGANNLILLGILEIAIIAIFLYPRTGVVGALLMIAYMGGAIAVHFVSGQPMALPILIQGLIWISSALRFPELIQRLRG